METEWRSLSLADSGVELIDCVHKTPKNVGYGYPYVAIPQMKEGHIDFASNPRRISRDDFLEWTKKVRPRQADVVLSRRCNPGETAYVARDAEFALGQNLVLLRADGSRIYPDFLRWLVRGPEWWAQVAKYVNVGAVFDSLRCADVPKFELTIPPLATQREISSILGALDDKIELDRRMNETLEEMAQALFKSWFVDFDPVRAKAAGKEERGVDEATAALFPSTLQDSCLGPIPQGWRVGPLSDLLVLQRGFDLPKARRVGGSVPVVQAGGIGEFHDAAKVLAPGVVTGRSGKLGNVFLLYEDFWPLNTTLYVKEFIRSGPHHAYFLLQRIDFAAFNAGSAVPTLNRNHLNAFRFVIPPREIVEHFETVAGAFIGASKANLKEIETLRGVRDALLPKLLSGELKTMNARPEGARPGERPVPPHSKQGGRSGGAYARAL